MDKAFDTEADIKEPHAFLQWKGTDACFDFYCKCGQHGHFDGYFAHYVKCTHCGTVYQMPFNLVAREVTDTDGFDPVLLDRDDERDNQD